MGSIDSIDLAQVSARARRAYELARLRRAAVGALPVVGLAAVATAATGGALTWWLGVTAVSLAIALLWIGRSPQRAVLPGMLAGAVPMALALAVKDLHLCVGEQCTSWCVPACAAGGVLAAVAVALVARRRGAAFLVGASAVALAIGAMGCACAGHAGVAALAIGFAVVLAPAALSRIA